MERFGLTEAEHNVWAAKGTIPERLWPKAP